MNRAQVEQQHNQYEHQQANELAATGPRRKFPDGARCMAAGRPLIAA